MPEYHWLDSEERSTVKSLVCRIWPEAAVKWKLAAVRSRELENPPM